MSTPTPYETLLDDGVLVEYDEGMGNAAWWRDELKPKP